MTERTAHMIEFPNEHQVEPSSSAMKGFNCGRVSREPVMRPAYSYSGKLSNSAARHSRGVLKDDDARRVVQGCQSSLRVEG
jgi:hypothetical protein